MKIHYEQINKGSISESTGMYACVVQFDMNHEYKGTLFEYEHGECELFVPLKKTKSFVG